MMPSNELFLSFLFYTFIIAAVIHLGFYLYYFTRLASYMPDEDINPTEPVSVIVCAKNELENLKKNLPMLLAQSHPDYEVIIVNDASWDETAEFLKEQKQHYPRLKVVTILEQEKYRHGKKFAVTLGIKAAAHEILLFSDADCIPQSTDWVRNMQKRFADDTEIVLGYGPFQKEKGILNRIIRFDAFMIAMQYFSFALRGNAYMGVGRNLAYRKSLFFANKGFATHNHIFSGDDDLFVNETATPHNVAIEIAPSSFTFSAAKKTFGQWLTQKQRHGTTAQYYKTRHQFLLALLSASNILFFFSLIYLLLWRWQWQPLVLIYGVKLLAEWAITFFCARKLDEKELMLFYPLHEIIHTTTQPVFYSLSLFTKQKPWK